MLTKMLCFSLLIAASTATSVGPGAEDGAPRKLRVLLVAPCAANCTCAASVTPRIHTSDGCVNVQTQNLTLSEDGCCGEVDVPTCAGHPDGCVMGSQEFRIQLLGGTCTCTSMDYATSGVESPQSQSGLGVGVWSNWITIGGFGLYCDDEPDDAAPQGNLSATCTAGGTPVPRTLVNIDFDYECKECAG